MKLHLVPSTLTLAAVVAGLTLAQAADTWIKYVAKPAAW